MFFFKRKAKKGDPVTAAAPNQPGFRAAVISDVGSLRDNNEDNFILGRHTNQSCLSYCEAFIEIPAHCWFFIGVFDGMGGGEIGEIAAKTAVDTILAASEQIKSDASKSQVDVLMRQAFLDANNKIIDLQQHHHVFGTTGTVLGTNGVVSKVYHLGDSRAYLVRNGELFQITRDQTLAQMKIDVGIYQPDAPEAEAEKHQLTEYIGKDHTKKYLRPVESDWFSLLPDDGVLLCSDGLYDMCDDTQIGSILSSQTGIFEKVKALTDAAISNGGIDNITCIYMDHL